MGRFIRWAFLAALGSFGASVSETRAANYSWNTSLGGWNAAANWNPSTAVPGAADTAFIANGGTATVASGVTASCEQLVMGGPLNSGTVLLSSGGSLGVGADAEYVGYAASGLFNQTGGTNNASASFVAVGYNAGVSGSYSLSGGGYLTAPNEYLGAAGSGAFTQSGGTNSVTNSFNLGYNAGGSGSYNLSGSGYLAAPYEAVGDLGGGTFTQSGGTNSVTNGVYLDFDYGPGGSYNLSGSGYLAASAEFVGFSGSGTFTQSGGTNSVTNSLYLGYSPGASGSYNLSGSGYLAAPTEFVGISASGSGAFTQSGGTNSATNSIYLGDNLGASGSYSLSGSGYLAAPNEYVGFSGNGSFMQSGGTNSVTGTLALGSNGGGGSYSLSDSGYLTAPNEYVGFSGNGSFMQSGGTNYVTGALALGSNGGGGSYTLNGGLLTAGTESIAASSSGGGGGGQSAFTQTGGTNSVSGSINLSFGGGSYSLSGGSLSAGTISIGGTFGSQAVFTQTGGTIGPGTVLNFGTFSYTSGVFNGRLVNDGSLLFNSSLYAGQGIENDTTITVPAGFAIGTSGGGPANNVDNEGTVYLTGGTLAGGQSAGNGGPIVNNGLITGYGFLASGVGITNNAQITVSGGNLIISAGTASMANAGAISLVSGYQLRLTSGTLLNSGNIYLNSSTVAGSGLVDNTTGVVTGPGTITAPFQNFGELNLPDGPVNITQPFTNSGLIVLGGAGANMTGGSVANTGSIQGAGVVASPVNNAGTGTIESIDGTLTLFGSVANNAGGLLTADAGSKLLVSSGLAANYGTINLTGGIFDNNSFALSNSGEITGYGTFRSGGLTNYNAVTFTGATSTINGPVTNASSGTINIFYNPAIFTGNVVNDGYVKTTSTTVTWAGGFTNNGTYHSDPAQNYFSSLANGAAGQVLGGAGDGFFVTGPLATNAGDIDLGETSTMVIDNGAGILSQSAGKLEMGTGATLSAGTVEISGGILLADGPAAVITANLVYSSSSTSTYQGVLAGAGNSLSVDNPLAKLVLSGTSDSYTGGTFVTAGELVVTSAGGIESGTAVGVGNDLAAFGAIIPAGIAPQSPVAVPEPSTLLLLASGAILLLSHRRRLRMA